MKHARRTLPRLLWRQFDQRRAPEEETKDISHDVVDNDQRAGQHKPDEALHYVCDKEAALHEDDQQDHVRPRELAKLIQV